MKGIQAFFGFLLGVSGTGLLLWGSHAASSGAMLHTQGRFGDLTTGQALFLGGLVMCLGFGMCYATLKKR